MKRPAFQFYPDNWRNSANLRRCSWGARGAWIEVMCLMHDSDIYGTLPWTLKEIAQALGCPIGLLRELVEKGVLKGCDSGSSEPFIYTPRSGRREGEPVTLLPSQPGPIWYSSRMVRDEYVRIVRGENGKFGGGGSAPEGGHKAAPKDAPKPPKSDGSSTPSPSSPSVDTSSLRSEGAPSAPTLPFAGPAEPPPDARTELFREGLARAVRLTGKPAPGCRPMLGRWLKAAGDDAALVGSVLFEAEQHRPADPVSWIEAAIGRRLGTRPGPQRDDAHSRRSAAAQALMKLEGFPLQ
ncbi:hypothetical protein [Rhodovarius lipocyclicus]|uniref:hypothetical protein n=1 Tax=Rhodovarius lipocyclicus TaxID=268410 RepID=UPI0013582A54|nr:hypothetical protein [Rhodovarius lipocyclicus]